jgi:regulator of nucleoside diphosphate kinase
MPHESCFLTTKDFTILEVMLDRCLGTGDPMRALLARKIESATVVFRDDIPPDVATLSSRVTFTVDGREPDTRILSHDRMTSPIGLFLPISTPRGLALLGLAAGQTFRLAKPDGGEERIVLEAVAYQPEAAKRERTRWRGWRHPPRAAPRCGSSRALSAAKPWRRALRRTI